MSSMGGGRAALIAALAIVGPAGCRHPVAPGATPILIDAGVTTVPRNESVTLVAEGIPRHLIVHLPGGAATTPRPLILNLHGSGSNGAQQQAAIGMDPV